MEYSYFIIDGMFIIYRWNILILLSMEYSDFITDGIFTFYYRWNIIFYHRWNIYILSSVEYSYFIIDGIFIFYRWNIHNLSMEYSYSPSMEYSYFTIDEMFIFIIDISIYFPHLSSLEMWIFHRWNMQIPMMIKYGKYGCFIDDKYRNLKNDKMWILQWW